ncbi:MULTISPECIES: trypsin-like peptidase domain-containing protein [Micromonospora]|uniref:trypsin-like peptidase domain-containing protein n=1 Tax=Micromonospora TaxID=1873 RepID=UPI001EE7835D|nr:MULTISPECIES: trypsin-like peptidase domain-containing protein [Micromonospora]MCG5453228.1 trypsin-like peptidase domain-containing protein [Micromonospora hortensis]MCX5120650.1 trypsin-like peptidase domain-containing protein [Micromonospora sp. NBC_00362]
MTEFESDPQRRPAPTDAEPSHPTAELPRDERAQSDSPTTPVPVVSTGGDPTVASTTGDAEATAVTPTAAPVGYPGSAAPAGQPAAAQPTGYEPSTGYERPAAAASAPPYPVSGHPAPGQPGYPQPAAGHYPGAQWYPGQQSGWAGGGQPGMPYAQHQQHPGQHAQHPGQHPHHPGQPVPPWGPQVAPPGSGPRPGRIAKFAGAGVAVFALMLGSGVAGGALALALDGDGGGITRTYSAAPVINGADLPKIAASVQDSVVSITTGSGEGSGVVLSADGYVLTNNHVVASAAGDAVRVVFADGKTADAKIIGTDPKTDLAVVKANGVSDLKPAKFGDSDAMQVGDQVLALGSPLGLQGSVTSGILSARDRTIRAGEGQPQDPTQQQGQPVSSISGLLQTDAPINPGNSGGALVNTRGEVIGVNTAIATSGQSTGNIGVGFAIPSNKAKDVAGKLQRGEKVSHPSLGVGVNQAEGGGALVASVTPGSPAEKAGLQRGDVVTRFGDKPVNDSDDLVGAVQAGKVGDRVEVQFKRNGVEKTETVTLAETS